MRILLTIVAVTAALIAIDAMAFHGTYRQAVWREAQTRANSVNYTLNRMMRFAGDGDSPLRLTHSPGVPFQPGDRWSSEEAQLRSSTADPNRIADPC
jgi:hypothetical protein